MILRLVHPPIAVGVFQLIAEPEVVVLLAVQVTATVVGVVLRVLVLRVPSGNLLAALLVVALAWPPRVAGTGGNPLVYGLICARRYRRRTCD